MKLRVIGREEHLLLVAPHVGAWIETPPAVARHWKVRPSLPMWERGLKPQIDGDEQSKYWSLPMWERGLKLFAKVASAGMTGRSPCGSVD